MVTYFMLQSRFQKDAETGRKIILAHVWFMSYSGLKMAFTCEQDNKLWQGQMLGQPFTKVCESVIYIDRCAS